MKTRINTILGALCVTGLLLSQSPVRAGTVTYTFDTDPTTGPNAIQIFQTGFADSGGTSVYWKAAGGNPGGFLGITWPLGSSTTIALFPDIDQGKIVTAFKFECDLRIGNPQQNERAADGFSINFARANDDVFQNHSSGDFATGGAVETGTKTGLAISFDTWSGNTLPDGADIEGIIVRVDNVTVLRQSMPTRNGECTDTTSLQTGPRNLPYWDDARANGTLPDAAFLPESWTNLCWQPLSVELDSQSKLTVIYKGRTILDHFQTSFFPSAGGIVLAGRTGGADEHGHFDNLKLTTTAITADTTAPTVPTNFKTTSVGARRIAMTWSPSTDDSGRVAYQIEKNGTLLPTTITDTNYVDLDVNPSTAYTYKVRATDVSGNTSAFATLSATSVAEVDIPGFLLAKIYDGIPGAAIDALYGDAKWPDSPDRARYVNGLSFGEPTFGNTYGDNLGVRIDGVLTAPETASYNFFIRSDDASQFFLNTAGAALPVPGTDAPIAEETTCCASFMEPPDPRATASPIPLVAGKQYGFVFVVKEGGGGDWGQVAMRKVGDLTAAAALQPIQGAVLAGKSDPVGASVSITSSPQSVSVAANQPVTFSVKATTASPYTTNVIYQWYKNDLLIAGATAPTYSIPFAPASDTGARFKVLVAVPGAAATSSVATLTVSVDTQPPTIVAVVGSTSFNQFTVQFSEPVTAPTATTAGNYSLSGGLTVSAPQLVDSTHVRFTTSAQAENTDYTLTVNNVQDTAGNPIAPNTTFKVKSFVFTPGKLKYEYWDSIGTVNVDALTSDPRFPNNPTRTQLLDKYEAPQDIADNYGARISGYITPQTDGNYVFFFASDDHGELYLSTDATPANKHLIAMEPGWNPARAWVSLANGRDGTNPENRSDKFAGTQWPGGNTITLKAGTRYYTEILFKEAGGGDNAAATWKLASAPDPTDASPTVLTGAVIGTFTEPAPPRFSLGLNFGANETATASLGTNAVAGIPSVAQANWNNILNTSGTTNNLLLDVNGTAEITPVTVRWSANNLWASTGVGEENNGFPSNSPNRTLITGYLDTTGTSTNSVTISNIPPLLTTNGYDVYIYAIGGVGGRGGSYRVVDATTKLPLTDYVRALGDTNASSFAEVIPIGGTNPNGTNRAAVGNYIRFKGIMSSAITVESATSAAASGGLGFGNPPRAPINAIQLVAPTASPLQDVTRPGDTLVASSTNSPAAEQGPNAIDNRSSTKYLNFDKLNAGFRVTPSAGASIVSGLGLTSANDSPERDPASYKLEGSNDGSTYTTISEGAVAPFSARYIRQEITFANSTAYTSYRLTFPTVANASSANSMQIAEVEFLGKVTGGGVTPSGPSLTATLSGTSVTIAFPGAPAGFILESSDSLTNPNWTAVSGVSNNSITINNPTGNKFYRLHKP